MGKFTPGYITVPGKGRRYRDADGNYFGIEPGFGMQTVLEFLDPTVKGQPSYGAYQNSTPSTSRRYNDSESKIKAIQSNGSALINRSGVTPVDGSFRKAVEQGTDGNRPSSAGNAGSGNAGSSNGGSGNGGSGNGKGSAPAPSSNGGNTGRNDTRVNNGGVVQSGTNMGPKLPTLDELSAYAGAPVANFAGPSFPTQPATNRITASYPNTTGDGMETVDLGGGNIYKADRNGRIIGAANGNEGDKFEGSQLPTTKGNPFSGNPADSPQFRSDLPGIIGQSYDSYHTNNGLNAASNVSGKGTPAFSGKEEQIKGASSRPSGSLADSLSDGSDLRFNSANYKPSEGFKVSDGASSSEEMRRRRAFLDAPDSMSGIKRVEAGLGYQVLNGKAYMNINGEIKEGDVSEVRKIKNAAPGQAQGLKDAYVESIIGKTKENNTSENPPLTPAAAQNPSVQNNELSPFIQSLPGNKKSNLPNQVMGIGSI